LVISSCGINNQEYYKESKLSEYVATQTKEIIESEVGRELTLLQNSNKTLAQQLKSLENAYDSLKQYQVSLQDSMILYILRVYFDRASYQLDKVAVNTLLQWNGAIANNDMKSLQWIIIGFSDDQGIYTYNKKLALQRAESVRLFLVEQLCVSEAQIIIKIQDNMKSCALGRYRSAMIQRKYVTKL